MYTVKYQNNSGDWFSSECPDVSTANVVYEWKKTGGVAQKVELWRNNELVMFWEKE